MTRLLVIIFFFFSLTSRRPHFPFQFAKPTTTDEITSQMLEIIMLVSPGPFGHKTKPILTCFRFRFSQPSVTTKLRVSLTKLRLPMKQAEVLPQAALALALSILRRAGLGLQDLLVSAGLQDLVGPRPAPRLNSKVNIL